MIKRNQRGFTLIEILLVVAITALIGSAAVMATFQVINGTKRSNDHMTAIQQVQNAGYWISHDALMAQSVVTVDDPETPDEEEFITLHWADWKNDEVHKIVYTFHDMADGIGKLKRQYLIYNANSVEIGNETILVAQYIDSEKSFFEPEEAGVWKLTIQACSGTQTETREYEINPRVNI